METCRWCGTEFPSEDVNRLDIDMPNYAGPYIRITNNLCPECSLKARAALAAVEIGVRRDESA